MDSQIAREMWKVLEPYHATVYFAPETKTDYAAIGLKGYWMGYFASRAAAMGAVPAEIVMATFYNFAPRMVRRAIPDAWIYSTPDAALSVRLKIADIATRRLLGDVDPGAVAEAAEVAERAALAAQPEGRALFAAHAALPWPEEPHLRLWHAATLLREHRGDGHVAVLLGEGISGMEAHLVAVADGAIDGARQREHRGFTDEEWTAGGDELRARGVLGADGGFTEAGRALKQRIEERTDALALAPYAAIGEEATARLHGVMHKLLTGTEVPFPNAMGVTR